MTIALMVIEEGITVRPHLRKEHDLMFPVGEIRTNDTIHSISLKNYSYC